MHNFSFPPYRSSQEQMSHLRYLYFTKETFGNILFRGKFCLHLLTLMCSFKYPCLNWVNKISSEQVERMINAQRMHYGSVYAAKLKINSRYSLSRKRSRKKCCQKELKFKSKNLGKRCLGSVTCQFGI